MRVVFRGAVQLSRPSLRMVSKSGRQNEEMAQFHGHRVETVQMLEWRPGFPETRNLMCIRGDLPCHIFLYLPATPPSRPVQARVHGALISTQFRDISFRQLEILV